MAEHCPPAIWVEGNAPSFLHLRGAVCFVWRWQWQSFALQRFGWRETLRRFRVCVGRCLSASFSGNGRALPSSGGGNGRALPSSFLGEGFDLHFYAASACDSC